MSIRASTVWRLGIKELWELARSPALLTLIVLVFTVQIYAAASATIFTLNKAPIAIVDEDVSPLSARIATAFYPPYFNAPQYIPLEEMGRRLDAGIDTFALIVPANFQRDVLAGRQPAVQLNVDATRMTQAFTGAGYAQAIVTGEVAEFMAGYRTDPVPPVNLALRARFNPELNPAWHTATLKVVQNVSLLAVILAGAALIRERERGTIEHLLTMPITPIEIMLGKIWPMTAVVLAAAILSIVVVVRTWLGIPVVGSLTLLTVGMILQILASASLGILLATLSGSMPQFGLLLMLILFPMQILSITQDVPIAVQVFMNLSPDTHFMSMSQAVISRGAGLDAVWPQLVSLLAIGLVFFSVSLWRFRKSLR